MPPLVPEGVSVNVPLAVTGDPETVNTLFEVVRPTLDTDPPPGTVHVFVAVQTFRTFDVVLKYCSPSVQVAGSAASLRAGMVWPAFVKSTTDEGAATTPPELTCDRTARPAHPKQAMKQKTRRRLFRFMRTSYQGESSDGKLPDGVRR